VYRWFVTRAEPLKDQHGRVLSWFGVTTDIHEQKELHEQLREADRRKDEFLATLAHELRNPLAPLRNAVEIMQRTGSDAKQQVEARQIVSRQVHQMVRLVDDLLDVSRISRGKLELRHERVPFATVLNDAVETSRPMLEAKRHELSIVLPEEQIDVDGDRTRLAQVFGNLLNNASKFTPEGGLVRLAAGREDGRVAVTVSDTGGGIAPAALPRIFEIFTRADEAPAGAAEGLGVGLSLGLLLIGAGDLAPDLGVPGVGPLAQLGAVGMLGWVAYKLAASNEANSRRQTEATIRQARASRMLAKALKALQVHCQSTTAACHPEQPAPRHAPQQPDPNPNGHPSA
jgi:two-component system CheB/CheR fusion protein